MKPKQAPRKRKPLPVHTGHKPHDWLMLLAGVVVDVNSDHHQVFLWRQTFPVRKNTAPVVSCFVRWNTSLTRGTVTVHSSPPNLLFICRSIFWTTLLKFCCLEIVRTLMAWWQTHDQKQKNADFNLRPNNDLFPLILNNPNTWQTWDGIGLLTQQSFLMALYRSSLLPTIMHTTSCIFGCTETKQTWTSWPEMHCELCSEVPDTLNNSTWTR